MSYLYLEDQISRWLGVENVVSCSSGTAALHLALEATRVSPPYSTEDVFHPSSNHCVALSEYNMIACPRAITLAGMLPVLFDCKDDLQFDAGLLSQAYQLQDYAAVLVTHIYGRRGDIEGVHRAVDSRSGEIKRPIIIEDMAELHGVQPHSLTDAACLSFYKNKVVAGEEGGCVIFKNKEHAALARKLRSMGFTDDHDYRHIPRGHNYRMSNVHAGLITQSLAQYGWSTYRRQQVVQAYDAHCPPAWKMPPRLSNWVYDIRISGMSYNDQDFIVKGMKAIGYEARHGFKPVSQQEEYIGCPRYVSTTGRKVDTLSQWTMYLPILTTGCVFNDDALAKRMFETLTDLAKQRGLVPEQ